MSITAFEQIQPEGHRESPNEVGYISPAEPLAGFEPGKSDSDCNALFYEATFPYFLWKFYYTLLSLYIPNYFWRFNYH